MEGHECSFAAAAGPKTSVAGGEVGVLGACGRDRGLAEDGFEPPVTGSGLAAGGVAGGLVVAGADPSPRREVLGGGEPGDVGADLGEDDLGGVWAQSGDGGEQFGVVSKGPYLTVDLGVEAGLHRGHSVDAVEHRASQERNRHSCRSLRIGR